MFSILNDLSYPLHDFEVEAILDMMNIFSEI